MYIVVGSITTATRLAKVIEKNVGIPANVSRTPSAIKNGGCSYSVRVNGVRVDTVKSVVDGFGVKIKGIFAEEISGGEREYRDIS